MTMPQRRSHRRRRGFSLTEMLAVIILLTAFAVVAERLFTATFRVSFNAREAQDATVSIESGISALRDDVWSAKKIESSDPQSATITLGDGRIVKWSITKDQVARQVGADENHWRLPHGVTLAADSASLTLKIPDATGTLATNEIRMTNQIGLIAKLTQ